MDLCVILPMWPLEPSFRPLNRSASSLISACNDIPKPLVNEALRVRHLAGWSPKLLPLSHRAKPWLEVFFEEGWGAICKLRELTEPLGRAGSGEVLSPFPAIPTAPQSFVSRQRRRRSTNFSEQVSEQPEYPAYGEGQAHTCQVKKRECHQVVNTSCQEGSTSSILEQPGPFLSFHRANEERDFYFSTCVPFIKTAPFHCRTTACSRPKLWVNYESGQIWTYCIHIYNI